MISTFILFNAIKIFKSKEYINPDKFNGKQFKAYRGWVVEVFSDLAYIYIDTAHIILWLGIRIKHWSGWVSWLKCEYNETEKLFWLTRHKPQRFWWGYNRSPEMNSKLNMKRQKKYRVWWLTTTLCISKSTENNLYSHWNTTRRSNILASKILQHAWRQENQNRTILPLFHWFNWHQIHNQWKV